MMAYRRILRTGETRRIWAKTSIRLLSGRSLRIEGIKRISDKNMKNEFRLNPETNGFSTVGVYNGNG
jgi:hypothetical protein